MIIKIIGFKVGISRCVYYKTLNLKLGFSDKELGKYLRKAIEKSDFISIRRID